MTKRRFLGNLNMLMIAVTSANNIGITRQCLESIPAGPKIVVYDDASTEPIERLCSGFGIQLYKEKVPKGLTNLWNRAYEDFLNSSMSLLLITNNDVVFPKGSIEQMVEVFVQKMPVMLGPLTNAPGTGRAQRIGNYLCNTALNVSDPVNVQIVQDMLLFAMPSNFIRSNYINGFCFMISKKINRYRYDATHLFPPQKINIGNEDWLCSQVKKRSKRSKGISFVICLTSFVFHYKGLTTRWCKKTSTKKGVNRENLWREV